MSLLHPLVPLSLLGPVVLLMICYNGDCSAVQSGRVSVLVLSRS